MNPEEFSRVIGQILGSAPFTMDERDRINEAMGKADSIEDMPEDIQQLLARALIQSRHQPGKHNQKTHGDSTAKASGTGASAKVTIDGKQYGVGDSITVNGKKHHIASIESDKVVVRPGSAPKPPKATTRKPATVKESSIPEKKTSSAEMGPVKGHQTPEQVKTWKNAQGFPKPKEHEKQALRDYSSKSYTDVNGRLREGKGLLKEGDPYGQQVWDMDQYMKRSRTKTPVTVSRKVGSWMFGKDADLTKLKGKTFKDDGYVSTTALVSGPRDGESRRWKAMDVTMSIKVPAGTKAAYMEELTAVKGQYELLLARGTNFKIGDVKRGSDGKWQMEMEVIQ